ncbi:hypothetical protein JHK87_039813 [Glycine soja]|nr:hypothetical protein JHK87_039813 [Glycine soja]
MLRSPSLSVTELRRPAVQIPSSLSKDQSSVPLSSSPTAPPSTTTLVVAPISVVDHYLPYEKHNLYDITFNNTVLCDHHHRVLTVVDVLRDTKQKRHPDG